MKKTATLGALLLALALPLAAQAETVFAGEVTAGTTQVIAAPYGGLVEDVRVRVGDSVKIGDPIATVETRKTYASTDGTVSGVFAREGDSADGVKTQYGALVYIEPMNRFTLACSTEKGYNSSENRYIHIGESVFLKCTKDGSHQGRGIVTAIDDGTMPNEWGSENIDDEGTPTQRLVLIENGVLRSYMVDRLNGLKMGMAPTGSARRENYTFAPTSRMHNTFIAPGSDDEDEMIRTMGDGLYAAQMGGGSVNTATGEFNFAVQEGYLIRDGKIASPVRGASLIGKGEQILMRIDRVGRHMTMGQGMCGSLSGSVPTNVGQPTIRVSSLTVGGK